MFFRIDPDVRPFDDTSELSLHRLTSGSSVYQRFDFMTIRTGNVDQRLWC